ncbi:MAG: type IV pilus secretin PilQ [Elusimicrobia bacterium]|nr:type IV pilus secretin PilQ [Elusimicrobiota bacterium]
MIHLRALHRLSGGRIPADLLSRALAAVVAFTLAVPAGPIQAWAADASRPGRSSLEAVEVAPDQIVLKLTIPAKYNTFVTANPPRLVLELLNTEAAIGTRRLDGKGKFLKGVRTGQFAGEPNPIARIVLDLAKAVNYRVSLSGSDLIVRLESSDASAEAPPPPAVPAKLEGRVPDARPDLKPEAKVEPKAKAEPKAAPQPEAKPAPAVPAQAAKAEPKAAPQAEAKPAAAAPAAKAAPKPAAPAPVSVPAPAPAPKRAAAQPRVAPEATTEATQPFSTEASAEVAEMGSSRRDATLAAGPKVVSGPITGRPRRDILRTLPRDPLTLDLDDVEVRDALKMLAGRAGVNVIYGSEVSGTMSVHLERVPFYEAFNIVLSMNRLVATQIGDNILHITTPTALKESRAKTIGVTRVFPIHYAVAEAIKTAIDAVRTAEERKGTTVVDSRNNALIITESPEGLAATERLIAELDTRPRQVLIESKLVEVKLNKDLHMGIQWDYFGAETGKALGKDGFSLYGSNIKDYPSELNPNTGAAPLFGQAGLKYATPPPGAAGRGTGVLLPADKVFGAFTLGRVANNYILNATLTAAAAQGKVKVLSDPKIATINGKQANINITTQTPYVTSSVTPTGTVSTSVSYITTGIQLSVKPTINADGRITLDVKPNVSQPSATGASSGISGAPAVDSRNADTTVVVRDGETIVIGGLITDSVSNVEAKVPLLGDIPILGWLFKKRSVVRTRVELLIFVTTKILPD